MSSIRAQKVSDFLRKEISLLISSEINDPRLKNINITAVKVSSDIGQATVFYTIIGQNNETILLTSELLRNQKQYDLAIKNYEKISKTDGLYLSSEIGRAETLIAALFNKKRERHFIQWCCSRN